MDLPRPLAVKVKKTARKSGPRCLDIPRKQLAGTRQFEANLSDIDDLASLEQAETAIPIPRQTQSHSSSFDYPNGLEHVRGSNPVSTPTDKILLSPSSTVSTFETVKSLSGACSSVVERWSSHSAINTVPFITKTTADSLIDQEQTLVSPRHVADTAYELVPLPFQKEDLGGELAPRNTLEIENVGKLNSPPVLTPIHSSRICSEGKRDTPPVLTPNTASENGIVAKKHLLPTGGVTVVSTADSFLAERELLSCLNADCPSSTPPVERKLFSHLNSDSPASPTQVERNLFSHMSVDSPASPPPSERTSSAQLQYLPPERKLFSHLKDDLSPMPPERKLFSHLKDEVSSLPPERKLFSHLKDDLQTLPVPLSRERKLFAHLNVDSPASPEESDGEEKRSVHSYANNVELKRVRVLRARSPDIPDSPEDNTLNGSSVSVGHAEAKSAAYGSDFQARLCEEDKCRSRLYENETSQHDEAASSSLVISATGARKTQDQGYCDTSVVNTDTGATEEGLKDSTLNQHSDQTAPVSKEILSLELSDPVALASSQESVAPNTSTCSISSVASAPVGSVRSSQVSVSRKETNLSHSRELESASAGILSISTGSRVNSARGPRKNIPSRTPTLSFLNDQVIRGYPSPNIPQGKAKPSMDSELINTSSSSRNLGEHIWYPSPNVYPEVNFEYKLHGSTSGPYYDYSSPHHQYSGIPSHFNMCDAQGNVYGFYTGYDVQGHLTAYPDPAYCHPQVDPAEMFYCDSLGNILQDQRGPSVNSSHWDESSMDKVNDVLLKPPLDRYISSESHKAPNTTPSESVGISSTIRNIVSSVKAVSEKSFGLSCGPKSSSGLVTRAPDDSARKPEPIEKVTNEGIAKSNAVDRQSVLGRSYAQNHDKARHTWPANLSLPRTDKGIKETGLKPQHKRQFIDSQSKCLSQNACDQKHTVGIKHSGSIPSGSDPPNKLNQKGEELLSALENVQNKILNQIDRTAKTMAKASVDQRKKSDSEHGPKQSQYRIPKRSSADAPKHKNIKSGGSKAEKPVISQKLEGKVVEKKLLEELRQKEKKLAEVMQEKAKLLAAKIEMDKEKNSPKLQVGKKSNEEQEKSDAGKSKIAGARMKMPLSFQQLFGNSLNYQGGTEQKAKKPASITSRRSKSTDSTDKGKAVSIGKRRNTADSRENADTINGGDTKASPIILDESSNTSWKSLGEKKAVAVAERRRSSNSTSSVSSAKSSQSHDSGKSHRSSSGGVSLADSTHRLKDGGMNSHKTKHRHSSSSHRNHGHGVKGHGHSSKHKSKETVLEHASRGHIHSKPGRDNEGAGHPLQSDDVLEKVKPRVKPQGETKGKKDEREPRKVVTVDPSKGPGKGKTLNINKRSEDDFKGSVNSKKLGDQFKGLQSGRPKKDSIPAQIFEHSVEQIKARLKGYEFLPDHGKVGSNYEENVSKFVDEEVSTEVQYAYEVHKTITDCTVRLCKMPTPKTPVNLTPEVIRRCSPCEYSSVLISKLDKKTRLQGVQVEVSRKLMNSKNKTDRLKDGLKLQQVGLSSSSDDDVPLNALLDKLRTPKKVKKIKRKKSGECSMKPTAIDLEKEVKNPTSADGKIFQDELNERRLVSKSDVHVSTAVEPKKANADNSERGRGRPASDKISKKRKNPDSDWTFKENKKRDSDGTGMENRKSYISCENKKFGLDKTSMTCKESQKHDSVGTCKERDSPDYNIACRKPDSDSICEESKKPVPNLTCKESRGKERGNSSNSVLICKEPDPHSTCEESGKPYSDLRYKESERPFSDSTRTEDKKPGSDSSCKKSEQPGPDNTCKESNEPGSDSSGNESKKSDPNSSCLESDKLDGGNFDAGLAVLNKKPETDAERVVLETDQEMFGKDATLDANGNVVCPESCGIAMHNLGEAIEDMGVVIKDTCLDTTDSSELSLGVSCCMEIMQRDDIVKEKGITTGACDEVVPLTPVSNSLADQPAVANMFNRDPGENPSLEVLGTPACEESITRIYEGLLPDDVKLVVPEKELLRDVDEPKATAICTETEVFVGPRSCPAYDRGAASGMKDLIGHMVSEIVRATKENRRKKDTLGDVNESIKAECQTPSVSNDSNDVLNRTSKTLNTTSSEDRTILYGDSSYDFENNSLCGSQGIFSASPEDEDEETHKLLPSRKESDYCQPDSRSESTLSADDFNIQLTPSTNPSSPRDRNSSELLTDKGGTYLPDLRNVSPVHFDGDSMDSFPGSVAVMSPNSFKDACSNIVGSARKRSVSFALMQAARNSAARKTARFYRTSSPADKTTLVSKLAILACKLDEQKSSEDAIKLGDAYIHVPSVDSDTDRLDKGGVLECSEYRTASVAVATPVCVEADQRLDVSTLDKAVESFEGGTLKESSDSRGDDTRSELVKISGVDATEDKTFEIGTKWKADEASGDGAGTITKIKITSEEAAIQTKYSAGFSEELVTEPPALGLPEAVDRTQGPDPYSADMQSTASKTAQTQSKDMAIDTSQDKTSSDADIQKNSPTLKIHVRSVKRDMQIMVDIEMVLRSLPAAVVPFLNQLKRYKATQEEVKNLQSLELPKSSSDESRGIDLVYYDDLTRIIDECMEAQNPRGKKDVLKEAEDPKEPTATSMSENTHWFGPETLSPTVQNKPFIKQTEMNAVASNQPGFLKLESSLNKTNQPVNINMPIVLISDKKLQLPPPASFLVISQNYRSSLCPVYTCPTAAVPCVGAELSGRRQSDPARPLVPGIFKLEPQEERLHSSTPSQKKTVKQLLAKTSQKQAVEQPAAGLQIHPAETSRKQSVEQPAAGLQIHPAETSRKQSVVQPAAGLQIHPAKTSRKQSVVQPAAGLQIHQAETSRKQSVVQPAAGLQIHQAETSRKQSVVQPAAGLQIHQAETSRKQSVVQPAAGLQIHQAETSRKQSVVQPAAGLQIHQAETSRKQSVVQPAAGLQIHQAETSRKQSVVQPAAGLQIHQAETSRKQSVVQPAAGLQIHQAETSRKQSVVQPAAGLQIHQAETSRKQSVVQPAAGLQIHQAETSRKQSVVQPAAQQHLHPAKMSRKQSVEQPITQGKASVCSKSRSDVILKPESRKTDRKKLGASLRERKVPGVQKIGKNYFTDDDVTLFRERLSETLDEVVQDLRNRLSATNASSAQDVFTNSDLSMHQAQNVCNRPTALIGQKRKRRNTHTSCARTRISQMETTDHSQMPNSASYREDHLYQFRGRIEEAMDTASDEVIDSAPKHEELVKIPVSGQSAIENPLRPASSSEEQMPEGNVKLEQGDIRMVPTLGSLASKIMKSAGELSELTVSDTSGFAGPTEESLQTSVLRTVGAGPAKILRRRKSDSDVATQMGVASHCISAPPLDTGDFTVDETDDRASRESVERHFMQAFVPLAGVEEIHRSDEKTVRIKQENEISPKKREQPDIRAARAVQPSSVLRLQDLVKETLITRRISLDAAMFDRVNRERDILFKAVDTSEMSVDDTSGELNTTTSLALDPEDDPKRKKVFKNSVPEFDIGQGLDFSFQTDKVGFIMPSPVDLMPVKDTSGHQHQSGMCATFSSDSTDTEEHFISSHAKGESGSDQILGLEISSDKEQGSIPGKVSSLIDEDKTGASRETDYADVHRTRLNEKDSYGSKEVGPFTSLQLENNEGNEESTKKEKGLSNEFEDNLHVNISTSSECSASSTQSRLFIDTDLDSSISTADKAHFSSESTSPDKAVSETVAQECGDELQEALYSIDGDGLEDTVNGNAEKDILSCACLEVGLCAEDFESCSEEGQTAANMLEGLNILEQGQAAGIADSHKESSQVGAIVLMEDRINEDCPVNVTGFVNSDDSISPVLHIPDTGLQATVEKIKPVLTLQHQPTVVSHEEENPPSSAQPPLLCNRNETTSLSTGLSLVSTMEENSACLTQKLPNSHREEQSALSHHQSLIGKVEDSSLSIQQPPVRDLKEMCLAFRSQGPAVRNGNNISTKDQCPKQVTSVTGIKTFREVTEKEVYQIEKAPSAEEDISLENSPLQQRIDMHGPSNDDMPLDLTKKGVSKRIFVPKAASHSMFYQSAVDLTVKKQEPSNRQWPGLGSLLNHACSSEPRFVSSGTTGHQQAGSQNACKVNRVGPEVIDITDCNPAKKCRTMSQENLTGPSPTDYRPKKVISPQLPLPFSTSYLNSNRQTEMCPEGVNSLPRQPVLNISRAPYGQWMMQSSGEGFLPNPAGGFRGPGGLVRGSFDAVEQRQNTATSSLGLYSNLTDTGPDYISSHLRNQVRPLQNATYQSFENRFLAQNYIDIVNRQFLAIKAQNEKKVAQGPTRHQNMVQNMASDDMLNAMPQGGSSGDMNNPVAAAQPKLSNPSNVPRGHVGSAANETGVDARARLRGVIQARTAGPDLSLRDAPNGVTLASPTVGLNRHTGPTFIPGVNMYPNPSVPSPGSLRSPNFQGVRPELSQMRQRMLHAGPDKQIFPLHPDPMLGMGLNSPFLSNIAGYPHAYPCLYDTRPPSNESMQQRFGSPNLNAAIPGKSPTLQGSGQKKSPAVTPEMVMPTNLTIQAWAAHPRNMHGNHQLSPNQMTPLVRFGNPGVGFPFYTCSPQQSRMLTPPVAQKLSERTPLLGTPTSAIRHHVVAAQNYDLLHQDHTEPVEQGVLAINPSAPALESLPEQRSARLVSQIPGNDQHKRDVSSTTFASHSPSSAAVSNVQSPKPSSGYSYRHPVFPIPSPVKNTPVSASSMMINQSPGKHSAVVAASPVRQHLAQIRPDSTASLTPVGGPEQGVHDELLALKRQLDAERQAREQVQLELEHYKKHHHKGRKKRKHQTGGEEEEEGQRKRHRSQETDG